MGVTTRLPPKGAAPAPAGFVSTAARPSDDGASQAPPGAEPPPPRGFEGRGRGGGRAASSPACLPAARPPPPLACLPCAKLGGSPLPPPPAAAAAAAHSELLLLQCIKFRNRSVLRLRLLPIRLAHALIHSQPPCSPGLPAPPPPPPPTAQVLQQQQQQCASPGKARQGRGGEDPTSQTGEAPARPARLLRLLPPRRLSRRLCSSKRADCCKLDPGLSGYRREPSLQAHPKPGGGGKLPLRGHGGSRLSEGRPGRHLLVGAADKLLLARPEEEEEEEGALPIGWGLRLILVLPSAYEREKDATVKATERAPG